MIILFNPSLKITHDQRRPHRSDGSPLPEMSGKSSKKGGIFKGEVIYKNGKFPIACLITGGYLG